jgi:hypothetical protein
MSKRKIAQTGNSEESQRPKRYYRGVPYWPAAIDDLGLNPLDVRIYLRICRRAGIEGQCWESIRAMALGCRMAVSRVQEALRLLVEVGLILVVYPLVSRKAVRYRLATLEPDEEWDIEEQRRALHAAEARREKVRRRSPSKRSRNLHSV